MATLNIGMIVKNEEKRLRQTLEALQPLRDAIDCRLIIADTGSNDGTIAIAQEFADIFLQITWENDFAKARNATLAEAKGDWFFYLDADEVLTNPEELITFLSKPKYWKKYQAISIKLQNLVSEKRNLWQAFSSERFFRIVSGQQFRGAIHETYPGKLPVYELKESYLRHYGYNNDDETFMRYKGERNVAIMEAQIARGVVPEGTRGAKVWLDYGESLTLLDGRIEDTRKAIEKAIEILKPLDTNDDLRIIMLARGYGIALRTIYGAQNNKECIKIAEEYFDVQPIRGIWDMDVYCVLGWVQMQEKQYEKAADSLKTYLRLSAKDKPRELTRLIGFAFEGMEDRAKIFLAQIYEKFHDSNQAWNYVQQIESKEVEGIDITGYCWQMAVDADSITRIPKLYRELSENNKEMILSGLSDAICKKDSTRQEDIAAGLRQIVADDETVLLPLLALATNDQKELSTCLKQMENICFTIAQGGIIRQCLKLQVPMNELLPHLEKEHISEYMTVCQIYYNDWLSWATVYYDIFKAETMTLSELWLAHHLLCIGISEESTSLNLRLAIWSTLIHYVGKYLHQVYQPIALTEDHQELLPVSEQFVLWAERAEEALAQKDYAQAIHALREGVKIYPSTQAVIERKLAEIEDLINPIGAELKQLAATVKKQINELIETEQLSEAEGLINELSAIIPDDPDIPYLLEQVQPADIIWN